MRIGFDLDNIFINTPPIIPHSVIERLYRGKTNGLLNYRIPSKSEQIIRMISHNPLLRPALKKNLAFVRKLTDNKDFELYLISSRFSFLKAHTDKIVIKHSLDKIFKTLYFNFENKQPHKFKNEIIRQIKLDKFIDDDLYLLKYIASRNNHVKLYWLNNKLNIMISKNIYAITELSDLFK